ncbi:MAG TPA: sodium-translocating pyrophosphatase [Candidatus Norongarragalinales archaeon]|jgi:K(+)-stimulated pyrophosphate-energized sodium pump|nr:sodium-translocating pyrophosphatase [Candidatus Norongarragalinales archaeon]
MAFESLAYGALGAGVIALLFAWFLVRQVSRLPAGTQKMQDIAAAIAEGADAYLNRQFRTVAVFVVALFVVIGILVNWLTAGAFVAGAVGSALAGFIGMKVAVRANVRTAQAAESGLAQAMDVAVKGGAVTGLALVGLGLIGISALYLLFNNLDVLVGFGFGASLISLFARVGGGIYTKAADVGADLVGKIEKGIPEDDPRNPAVIADNVGDNVGDNAGMAADVFESYVVTIIAAMLLGASVGGVFAVLPLAIAGAGIVAGIAALSFMKLGGNGKVMSALNNGLLASAVIAAVFFAVITFFLIPGRWDVFGAAIVGLAAAVLIGYITEFYTGLDSKSVAQVANAARTGAGTNVISGLAVGLQSTAMPLLLVVFAILLSFKLSGIFGIAIAAAAMLSVTGVVLALDAFGPITDNAGGIAEMSKMKEKVRKVTDELDAVGNTTKATTKGFAITGAALSAIVLFAAFAEATKLSSVNILSPAVTIGLFIGAMLPFLFSSFLMNAVGKAAFEVVEEVRHQFKTIKGIMSGKARPNYARVVDITTAAALKELKIPGLLAVGSPLLVGILFGPAALAGLLAGAIASGFLLALTLSNAGAVWDNAKKFIELGNFGGKGSDAHKAAVVGDTVGDPSKDTAGPALNSLIKVLNTISLIFAAAIAAHAIYLV